MKPRQPKPFIYFTLTRHSKGQKIFKPSLTEVVIILLLPVLLESFQVLLRQRLLLDGHSWYLIEEIQEGVGVDVTGHHVDVILHHFDVGHGSLVQRGVGVEQFVEELVTGD